ncbi:MAG: hypothetical protein D6705_17250 [Deltaproteobacteria bacterium]|nr:MAG: hypothetical protein D6705_17250 [Deltaproteobacteria bacterium]
MVGGTVEGSVRAARGGRAGDGEWRTADGDTAGGGRRTANSDGGRRTANSDGGQRTANGERRAANSDGGQRTASGERRAANTDGGRWAANGGWPPMLRPPRPRCTVVARGPWVAAAVASRARPLAGRTTPALVEVFVPPRARP